MDDRGQWSFLSESAGDRAAGRLQRGRKSVVYARCMDGEQFWVLEHLTDAQLLEQLRCRLRQKRRILAELVAHLAEVEQRRLHLTGAHGSLFSYCVHVLGMSEDEACRRIELARLARKYPALFSELASGRISLSVALLLKPFLSADNQRELIAAAAGASLRTARELLAASFPRADVADRIRKLPERAAAPAAMEEPAFFAATGQRAAQPAFATSASVFDDTPAADAAPPATAGAAPPATAGAAPPATAGAAPPATAGALAPTTAGTAASAAVVAAAPTGAGALAPPAGAPASAAVSAPAPTGADARTPTAGAPTTPGTPALTVASARAPKTTGASSAVASVSTSCSSYASSCGGRLNQIIEPLSPARYRFQFTADAEVKRKLELARDLLRHAHPDGDFARVISRALDLLLDELLRRRFASRRRSTSMQTPRETAPNAAGAAPTSQTGAQKPPQHQHRAAEAASGPRPSSTHQSADIGRTVSRVSRPARREVLERDGLGCSWVDDDGVRCDSTAWLEVDHRHPAGKGGASSADNLRMLCRAHNRVAAERAYGRDWIEQAIARRQHRKHPTPPQPDV